jgi:hypothetical protein
MNRRLRSLSGVSSALAWLFLAARWQARGTLSADGTAS